MISAGRKLFDEVDMPLESKIVSEDPINKIAKRESFWTAEINGIDPFPSGKGQAVNLPLYIVTVFQFQVGKVNLLHMIEK